MALNQHATLLCSLPPLPVDFEQPHVPLSWPRMESRVRMLDPHEIKLLGTLADFWRWEFAQHSRQPSRLYEKLLEMSNGNDGLRQCLMVLADIRMLTVAVRAKAMEMRLDTAVGRWGDHVRRNWQVPDFGLSRRFPWLTDYGRHVEQKRYTEAERKACQVIWREMARVADYHSFDLAAIIAYLVRWELISRWAARDGAAGRQRFNTLVEEAIGDYAGKID